MAAWFGTQMPVLTKNLVMLKDEDIFYIDEGEELRMTFTPGYQTSVYVT
jgi:hypothetical protein